MGIATYQRLISVNPHKTLIDTFGYSSMPSRRQLLATAATLLPAISGCTAVTQTDSPETDGDTKTDITTNSEIISQATEASPAVISFRFTNDSGDIITVVANASAPFTYFPRLSGSKGEIVVVPVRDDSKFSATVASSQIQDCWRFREPNGEEAALWVEDSIDPLTMDPGQTYSVRHRLYFDGEMDGCFPDGHYSTVQTVSFDQQEFDVSLNVSVSYNEGKLSNTEVTQEQ
jgi:hypothetical protein